VHRSCRRPSVIFHLSSNRVGDRARDRPHRAFVNRCLGVVCRTQTAGCPKLHGTLVAG
jgi:hypothetical protein